MESLLHSLLAWVDANPAWAGVVVFLVALSESLVVVGLVVPGTVLMFGIGVLVGSGNLGLWETLVWAFAGAVVGDGLSFWLGRHFRDHIRNWWPFRAHPQMLVRGEAFFLRHGGKSVLIGRFVGPVRPVIPAVAGMMGMAPGKFLVVNLVSALLWAPAYLLPGIAFGTSLALASQVATRLALFIVLVVGGTWFALWLVGRSYRWALPRAGRLLQGVVRLLARHPRLAPLLRALTDPKAPVAGALMQWAGILVLSLIALALLPRGLGGLDQHWARFMDAIATPWGDRWMGHVAALGEMPVLLAVAVAGALWWWRRGERAALRHWLAGLALIPLIVFLDAAVDRPLVSVATLGVMVEWGLLTLFSAPGAGARGRRVLYTLWALVVVAVAAAHLYLGVATPGPVLAGILVGLGWVAVVGIVHRLRRPGKVSVEGVALVFVVALLAALPVTVSPQRPTPTALMVTVEDWWQRLWQSLPAYRVDLGGESEQPFTIQWGGTLEGLEERLRQHGWARPAPLSWRRLLNSFQGHPPMTALPVLPQLHEGRPEALILVWYEPSERDDSRWVLRLWESPLALPGNGRVWQGYVARQRRFQPWDFVAIARTEPSYDHARDLLAEQLSAKEKRVFRQELALPTGWDGRVLLAHPGEAMQ